MVMPSLAARTTCGAGQVFDHDRMVERLAERRRQRARQGIDAGAGRIWQDQPDRLVGHVLRTCRCERQADGKSRHRSESGTTTTVTEFFHAVSRVL
jgi:hypothetical protein